MEPLKGQLLVIVEDLTRHLYPWLSHRYKSTNKIIRFQEDIEKSDETGIVMSVGRKQFPDAIHSIYTLHKILKSKLPIEVHYCGERDLTADMVEALMKMPNVKPVNLLEHFPQEIHVSEGWSTKPYAILASSFRTVILMDADVRFFQPPENITSSSKIFDEYGLLFYHDRSIQRSMPDYASWFKFINPQPTRYGSTLRYTNSLSYHEQESGVVIIDKSRIGALHSLLLACAFNSFTYRSETYKHMYGDKETFWISWELLRVPYRFSPTYAGALGVKTSDDTVCGNLFHVDEFLNPVWWNGGMWEVKEAKTRRVVQFEYLAFDSERDELKWFIEYQGAPHCLSVQDTKKDMRKLNADEKQLGERYIQSFMMERELRWKKFVAKMLFV
ncbi:hypothetical protein BCR33DRAFT_658065 [Rhizoclosmatium globosum]|uniref:Nucleotide-diphospho-sugar transferase n=1 Tax=Rhizoclosmatium globosum TaxID=329046 RepID=A0A1Y2CLW3_9FUNG|nr:hypothetical protein BCR33DRAFT_658065 [Rhizoclosmatium globosum]|eukprot:ORY47864.1 hypothetical protein BCR33DRAFT_658065 [Rhizoclosmatium globosum]